MPTPCGRGRSCRLFWLEKRRNPEATDDDNAIFFLIDGWHRFEAATKYLGWTEIDCEVTGEVDIDACRWMAVQRNQKNAVRYRKEDRLGVFRAYVEAGQHLERKGKWLVVKSARRISDELPGLKISARLVGKWMLENYPDIYEAMPGGVVQPLDKETGRERANEFARERRRAAMQSLLDQAVAIYRDTPRFGDERKEYAAMVKRLPVRMTKGRIKRSDLEAYERLFDEEGIRETPNDGF